MLSNRIEELFQQEFQNIPVISTVNPISNEATNPGVNDQSETVVDNKDDAAH